MNILLTEKCTNRCPYCFAQTRMINSPANAFISLEVFKELLDFLCKSKVEHINLIGGEPLIHPNLVEIINMVNKIETIKTVSIFTGGIVSLEKVKQLSRCLIPEKYSIIFNLNNKKDYLNKHYLQVTTNIKYLKNLGFNLTIGYNIYEESFNYKEIFDTCENLGIFKIRWSIAYPGIERNTRFIHPVRYNLIRDRVYQFILEAYERNFELMLDCQLPLCFFTEEQISKILFLYPQFFERLGKCTPAIDIGVNLEIWRCFALYSDIKINLKSFNNINEIYRFFKIKTDNSLLYTAPPEYCTGCKYWEQKLCQGGCLSFNIDLINKGRKKRDEYENLIDTYKKGNLITERALILHCLSDCIDDADLLFRVLYAVIEKADYDIIAAFYNQHKLKLHRLNNPVILYLISLGLVNSKDIKSALTAISEGLKITKSIKLKQKFEELLHLIKK
jgi:MoaA/NifB/PqqE/SkfB family radical SAM enzyme